MVAGPRRGEGSPEERSPQASHTDAKPGASAAYATVVGILEGDEYLLENGNTTSPLGQYYIAFFGDPSDTSAYEVQFGGHHPGVQPAVYTNEDGEEVQPFAGIYTDAFAFFDSLTAEQQTTLISGDVTMCAPGDTCDFETGAGLTGADLADEQKQLLLALIANRVGMADEQTTSRSRRRMAPGCVIRTCSRHEKPLDTASASS